MRLGRLVTGGLLAGLLTTGLLGTVPAIAAAGSAADSTAGGTVVAAGKVLVWNDVTHVLPSLPKPRAGTLAGYGFSATVSGDACAPSVGTGNNELVGPAGADVCVFSLDYQPSGAAFITDTGQSIPAAAGAVNVGTALLPLSLNDLEESATSDYAVAVPTGQSATLVLGSAGFSQSFSLSTATTTGERPTVLYAAPRNRVVAGLVGTTFRFAETSSDGKTATLTAKVAAAELDWFLPGDPLVRPKSPDQAFLAVDFGETQLPGAGGVSYVDFVPLPGRNISFSSAGHSQTAVSTQMRAVGLLDGTTYVFTVPADDPSGRLTITPGTRPGNEATSSGTNATAVEVHFSSAVGGLGANRAANGGIGTPATAAAGAGGVVVLVLFVVIPIWRRRKGERIVVVFPRAGPLDSDEQESSSGGGTASEETEATQEAPAESAETRPGGTYSAIAVRVIGPIQVEPLAPVERRNAVVEACAYLAMNDGREVTSDEFRHALGSGEKDLSPRAFYNVVSDLRKALGRDILVTSGHAGYRFSGKVTCDWVSFKELVRQPFEDDEERIANLHEALALVRGYPFQSASKDRYQWAHDRNYTEEIVTAVDNAAVELCEALLLAGRDTEAFSAAQLGLRAARQSHTLHACRLRAARGDRGRLEQAWQDSLEVLGDVTELRALRDALVGVSG